MKKAIFFSVLMIGLSISSSAMALVDPDPPASTSIERICEARGMQDVEHIINWATCLLVGSIIPLLVALAVIGFIWGVIQYFLNPDNEEKRKKGKTFMLWGIIALFVIVSIWGIVGVFSNTFKTGDPVIPTLPE